MNFSLFITFSVILLVIGLFLVIAVLMQHGKSHGLSGTIAGAAESFLGKERGSKVDRILSKMTTILGVVFVVIVIAVYIIQPTYSLSYNHQSLWQGLGVSESYGKETQTWVSGTEAPTEAPTGVPAAGTVGQTTAPTSAPTTAPTT